MPKHPTIADAKALALKYPVRGVVVLSFGGGQYGLASYGVTRRDCDDLRTVVDDLAELIASQTLIVPYDLTGGKVLAEDPTDRLLAHVAALVDAASFAADLMDEGEWAGTSHPGSVVLESGAVRKAIKGLRAALARTADAR